MAKRQDIFDAVKSGNVDDVKFHFERCDKKLKTGFCERYASLAVKEGHLKVVKFLVQTVADQNMRDQLRFEAAVSACSTHQDDVVAFLRIEPDWLFKSSEILSFAASMAIEGRNSALTRTLSQMQPAQITQLLCLSISQGHVALALTLLSANQVSTEHVDKSDSTGATALMLAADAGHHELIEKLLGLGASVRAEDSQGRTALTRAVEAGHVRAAKTLMDGGADASHRDGRGQTCTELAERLGRSHSQVLRLLRDSEASSPQAGQPAAHRSHPGLPLAPDDPQRDRQLSEDLHRLLSEAGFTRERAERQQRLADWLEGVALVLTQDDRHMTGSYAEGWANSLVQVNGRTAADSDIDWTVLVAGQKLHLEGGCYCHNVTRLQVKEGHAQVPVGSGSQPAVAAKACGVRPAQDTCHAIPCCSGFCKYRVTKLIKLKNDEFEVHLVRATRPNSTNELRVSFSFQEKRIMRQLSTVQGQLFAVIKFIFKRLLPDTLDTHGLKTYNAKTLLFFMLERHGTDPSAEAWQPQNLIALLKESLDMMLSFIDSTSSPDECMPHFFMRDAPLYFKNAGIGGGFDNTKARVRDRLRELRSDNGFVVEQLRGLVRPLQSERFFFHPFTLLQLTAPPSVTEIRDDSHEKIRDVYSVVQQCVSELQSESTNRDTLLKQLNLLHQLEWCKCATLCLTAMAHLKLGESEEAERVLMELQGHRVSTGFKLGEIERLDGLKINLPTNSDWAWRFCLPCDSPPRFPFLPEFTQTLFTARLSQPRSSHLYVSFRCLSWSLQAELLRNRTPIAFGAWLEELQEDADLEELLTLAHYSDSREHVELSLRHMETIRDERRVAMETQDEEKITWVREKLLRLLWEQPEESGPTHSIKNMRPSDSPITEPKGNPEFDSNTVLTDLTYTLCRVRNLPVTLTSHQSVRTTFAFELMPQPLQEKSSEDPEARKWRGQEDQVFEILKGATESVEQGAEAVKDIKKLLTGGLDQDEYCEELTQLANSVADRDWPLGESDLRDLLKNSAGIVRKLLQALQRDEAQKLDHCPVAEAWFCFMMAVWSWLRTLVSEPAEEVEKFRACL